MENIILINGRLSQKMLSLVKDEIETIEQGGDIYFIVNSEGGDTTPTKSFIDWYKKYKSKFRKVFVKIYKAESAAAILALCLASVENRSITKNGIFMLHDQQNLVGFKFYDTCGKLHPKIYKQMTEWSTIVSESLKNVSGNYYLRLIDIMDASGFKLSPKECLESGVVSKII